MNPKGRHILVVGSINMDMVSSTERIPIAGETVMGNRFELHPGGKGANQAVAIARLGYPVQMIGKLGCDAFGGQMRSYLEKQGVGLAGVGDGSGPTGTASITVAKDGQNCIVVTAGANQELTADDLDQHRSLITNAILVLAQLEIPLATVERLAEICREEERIFVLDPAPAQSLPATLFKQVTWFTPNETEASFYTSSSIAEVEESDSMRRARLLLDLGPEGVILKMGARGAYLLRGSTSLHLNAPRVSAVDTTAAGDAFNGAFATGIASGKSWEESVRFAIAAASLSVTRAGAQPSMPSLNEVERSLAIEPSTA
jgi:ribokinase